MKCRQGHRYIGSVEQIWRADRDIQAAARLAKATDVKVEGNRHVEVGRNIKLAENVSKVADIKAAQRQAAACVLLQIEVHTEVKGHADVGPGRIAKPDGPKPGVDARDRSTGGRADGNRVAFDTNHLVRGQPGGQCHADGKIGFQCGIESNLNRIDNKPLLTEKALGPADPGLAKVKLVVDQGFRAIERQREPNDRVARSIGFRRGVDGHCRKKVIGRVDRIIDGRLNLGDVHGPGKADCQGIGQPGSQFISNRDQRAEWLAEACS